jgi:hypothetical protein
MKRSIVHPASRVLLIVVLMLWVSACENGGGQGRTPPTPPPVATPTPTAASILLGPQPGPTQVQNPAYWDPFVHPTATQHVEGVICGYLTGQPLLQAVVTVRSSGAEHLLALHVFTNLTSSPPAPIFSLSGLQAGDAKVSYNTLVTNQEAWQAVQNEQIRHTLAREFKWSESAQTLVQVGFVGLYPDLTRYQAEAEQAQVNASQGNRGWQLDAVSTAQSFAEFVLHWPSASPTTVVSGGGTHDARAVVQVTNTALGHAMIQVSLSRLELNTNGGIWEVTDVATKGMAITAPQSLQQLTSPAQVSGSASPASGEQTVLAVLNDEQISLGQKTLGLSSLGGTATFSTHVTYTSSLFRGAIQEGIIALYTFTANQQMAGCVMVKVLLQA